MATHLTCTLEAGDPATSERLCVAVKAKLDPNATGRFDLHVTQARQTFLQARLSHSLAKDRIDGPEMTLSVIDRDSFPDQTLASFATNLVASVQAGK